MGIYLFVGLGGGPPTRSPTSACGSLNTTDTTNVNTRTHPLPPTSVFVYDASLSTAMRQTPKINPTHIYATNAPENKTHTTQIQQLQALALAFRGKVEARLALEKELVAAAARYNALANEVLGFIYVCTCMCVGVGRGCGGGGSNLIF